MQKFRSKDSHSGWFWAGCVLAVLCCVAAGYAFTSQRGAERVVSDQLSKLKEKQLSEAYYEYSSEAFQRKVPLLKFKEIVGENRLFYDQQSFRVVSKTVRGNIAKIIVALHSDGREEARVHYSLLRDNGEWKISTMHLVDASNPDPAVATLETLQEQVEDQLAYLQNQDLASAYYDFFATEFRNETPFEQFCEYVQSYPILTEFDQIDVVGHEFDGDDAHIDFRLLSDFDEFFLRYRFKKENGAWRVWNLQLTLSPEESERAIAEHPEALEPPVRYFLDALSTYRFDDAYHSTSREFQDVTSFNTFRDFVQQHPVLQQRDLTDIKTGVIENGVGKMVVNLHDTQGLMSLEFKLGYEVGQWRIWGLEVSGEPEKEEEGVIALADPPKESPLAPTVAGPTNIFEISIGETVDQKGLILHPETTIDHNAKILFFNVKVENGVEHSLVMLTLDYIDGKMEAPYLSTQLAQKGSSVVSFSYKAPEGGWPIGDYVVKVKLDSGQEKIQKFQITDMRKL